MHRNSMLHCGIPAGRGGQEGKRGGEHGVTPCEPRFPTPPQTIFKVVGAPLEISQDSLVGGRERQDGMCV